jgi:hypothetical protein
MFHGLGTWWRLSDTGKVARFGLAKKHWLSNNQSVPYQTGKEGPIKKIKGKSKEVQEHPADQCGGVAPP